MDVQMANNLLFVAIAVVFAVVIVLMVKLNKAKDRELDLILKVKSEKLKTKLAEEKRNIFEELMNDERNKLNKLHLLNFSVWLFDDKEFVSAIASKVDELRPAALDRYNTKQRAELDRRAEADAASMKQFQASVEADRKMAIKGKNRIVSGGGISGTSPIVAPMIINDSTPVYSGGDSCSVDVSSCM